MKLNLDRMTDLMLDIGSPQNNLSGFHVAGTNGKGSVCATLEALALEHGQSCGLNTSPHLIRYNERFRVNGKELEMPVILKYFKKYQPLFEKREASFFEISTALAFILFEQLKVQTSIIEVGLGGRLDATNVFDAEVAAITTIGLDHVKTLGNSLVRIAAEKAGILKNDTKLVLGNIEPSALRVITQLAVIKKISIYRYGLDILSYLKDLNISGITFDYSFRDYSFKDLHAKLLGAHQVANISTALSAFILYSKIKGFEVSEQAVRKALDKINWQGRMQVLSSEPPIILDGAHNLQGVQALIETVDLVFPKVKPRFLISILGDKDYSGMIKLLCSRASHIYVAQNMSDRAATVEEQLLEIKKHNVPFSTAKSVAEAYNMARNDLKKNDVLICGGSLYTVGEILDIKTDD